jgi:hypothetical protein
LCYEEYNVSGELLMKILSSNGVETKSDLL